MSNVREEQTVEVNNKIVRSPIGECVKVFPTIVKSTVGGVCVWVRTDSPATPLPKIITASTTSSLS